ncbi:MULTISPECIES: methyl-accepting chemotaxis protein [Azospira]|jgi:methyl-accepting chemotaxis protein|uniref:Methyl-accepting chemotaxis protein n=1 Tax=Azospira oryzae (strain ATCC BAA-33 / DSM 13638 / PS) TaxID=640081 RepID=G8QLI3_AZOOP|nr:MULTISPECIES: methyl-accepting chemotaxis protein [Azospira]AEV24512.1 methyl-accepting chemotaxis protein [Azospira oryzae PS]MDK9689854.1 methyl-accepting chemotaxis protein [Azospira sp.]
MFNFERIKVRTRLMIFFAGVVLGLLAVGIFSLYVLRDNLMEDRRLKTRNVVESVLGVVDYFHKQQQAGKLSEEEAKRQAMDSLRNVRYDGKEYFWVQDRNLVMLMHPIKPDMEGKSQAALKDPNGKLFFQEMENVVKASGKGFVDYLWPKPGFDQPAPKISYVAEFPAWGWVVGSGIYVDDVNAVFRQQALLFSIMVVITLAILSVISWLINSSILRQLGGEPAYAVEVVRHIAEGDLVRPVEYSSPDSLLAAMQTMQQKLANIFGDINGMASRLSSGAEHVSVAARETSVAAHNQAQSTSASAASIEQMTVSISEVSEIATQTEANSSQTAALAEEGAGLVKNAAQEIELISRTVATSSEQIQLLQQRSQEIGGIANVIKEIADQTNLLALNAAIEAARAGEQGRGFAVVADEVRKLAERTAKATTEIAQMIDSIQEETQTAVQAMATAAPQVDKGLELATQATAMLDEIHRQALDSLGKVRDVALATTEQATTATDIAKHVEHIASMAEETNATMQNNAAEAEQLEGLADQLRQTVSYFRVS